MDTRLTDCWEELSDFIVYRNSIDLGGTFVLTQSFINSIRYFLKTLLLILLPLLIRLLLFFQLLVLKLKGKFKDKLISWLSYLLTVWLVIFIVLVEMVIFSNQTILWILDGCHHRKWVWIIAIYHKDKVNWFLSWWMD